MSRAAGLRTGRATTWPVPPLWVAIPSAVVAVASLVQMAQVFWWSFVDLPAVSALPMSSLLITGPVVAASAALVTSWTWSSQSPLGSGAAVRSGHPAARRQAAVLGVCLVTAFVATTLPVVLISSARSSAGSVQWGLYLYAVAALVVFIAVGFVIGAVFPYRLSFMIAIGIAGLLSVIQVYIPSTRPARVLAPIVAGEFHVGDSAPLGWWLAKSGLVVAAGLALLWCSGRWPEVRYSRSALILTVAPILAVFGAAGALAAAGPTLHTTERGLAAQCETPVDLSGPTICLSLHQSGARDTVRGAVARTLAVVGGPPDQLTRVSADVLDPDRRQASSSAVGTGTGGAGTPDTVWVTVHPEADITQMVQRTLLTYLSGIYACSEGASVDRLVRTGDVDRAIESRLDNGSADEAFAAWYSQNQASILSCDAPPLPSQLADN